MFLTLFCAPKLGRVCGGRHLASIVVVDQVLGILKALARHKQIAGRGDLDEVLHAAQVG